jgi:antibiotic biosynthesis monooxygenase (ABM) superfamily enzyme
VRAPWQWWLDRRPLGAIVDGEWVPAPQRLEHAWAWLSARPAPRQPPRRITTLVTWAVIWALGMLALVAPDVLTAIMRVALYALLAAVVLHAAFLLWPRKRSRR